MTTDNPSPTPALTLSDKLMAMNHLTTFVPEKLDVDAMNYSWWVYYFSHLCHGYGILDHLVDPVASSTTTTPTDPPLKDAEWTNIGDAMNYSWWVYYFSHLCHGYGILDHLVDPVASSTTTTPTDPPPKDAEWIKIGFIIRSWIFSTLAPSLRKRLVDLNPTTAKDAWTYIAGIFQDNKRLHAMALKAEQGVYYPQQGVQTLSGPPQGVHLVPGPSQPPVQFTTGVQQQQRGSFPGSVHLGQSPSMPFHPSQLFAFGSQVGDERFIPVTNSGHSVLSTHFRPLRLNNVLITPNIVKNLISVRSTGDLYPVTKPSTIPHAFLTSQYTWHQRLGHLGSEVLRRLVSSDSISCNKEKLPVLCHACQLGKHVKLSFVSSSSSVTSCFDIVHSDL
nr:ribonuclease H-like domain-containing protein [Tanacetum cinerariifolium]